MLSNSHIKFLFSLSTVWDSSKDALLNDFKITKIIKMGTFGTKSPFLLMVCEGNYVINYAVSNV